MGPTNRRRCVGAGALALMMMGCGGGPVEPTENGAPPAGTGVVHETVVHVNSDGND